MLKMTVTGVMTDVQAKVGAFFFENFFPEDFCTAQNVQLVT